MAELRRQNYKLLFSIKIWNSLKFIFPSPSRSASAIMAFTSISFIGSPRLLMVVWSSSSVISPGEINFSEKWSQTTSPSVTVSVQIKHPEWFGDVILQIPPVIDKQFNKFIEVNAALVVLVHILYHLVQLLLCRSEAVLSQYLRKVRFKTEK